MCAPDQPELAVLHARIGLPDGRAVLAERLHLRAAQDQACLDLRQQLVVVSGLAVRGDDLPPLLARRTSSAHACGNGTTCRPSAYPTRFHALLRPPSTLPPRRTRGRAPAGRRHRRVPAAAFGRHVHAGRRGSRPGSTPTAKRRPPPPAAQRHGSRDLRLGAAGSCLGRAGRLGHPPDRRTWRSAPAPFRTSLWRWRAAPGPRRDAGPDLRRRTRPSAAHRAAPGLRARRREPRSPRPSRASPPPTRGGGPSTTPSAGPCTSAVEPAPRASLPLLADLRHEMTHQILDLSTPPIDRFRIFRGEGLWLWEGFAAACEALGDAPGEDTDRLRRERFTLRRDRGEVGTALRALPPRPDVVSGTALRPVRRPDDLVAERRHAGISRSRAQRTRGRSSRAHERQRARTKAGTGRRVHRTRLAGDVVGREQRGRSP